MIIDIDSNQLEIGMYVILVDSLFENPFWKTEFVIEKQKQIQKIINAGIKKVKVDTEKGKKYVDANGLKSAVNKVEVSSKPQEKEPATPPDKWEPAKFMPPKLVEAFKDVNLPPADRAKVVHDYSIEMMKNILERPTAETIAATKEGVAEIVDAIMNEGETCDNLTKIVSHDFYTYTHSVNVGIKSVLLAKSFYGDSGVHDMHELGAGFFFMM